MDNDADNSILIGYVYKLTTPEIKKINRSLYVKRTDFTEPIFEDIGNNC